MATNQLYYLGSLNGNQQLDLIGLPEDMRLAMGGPMESKAGREPIPPVLAHGQHLPSPIHKMVSSAPLLDGAHVLAATPQGVLQLDRVVGIEAITRSERRRMRDQPAWFEAIEDSKRCY